MTKRKTDQPAPAPDAIATKIVLETTPETPVYYVNYADISFSAYDFGLAAKRIPTKLPAQMLDTARAGGALTFEADIQLIIPPTVIPGLIRALTTIKEQFEKQFGTIPELGAEG